MTTNTDQNEAAQASCAPASGSAMACAATPRDELLRQLLDSRVAKNEREWAGAREIERLRGIIARNARSRLSGEDGTLYVTAEDIKDSLEILYAEMERGDLPSDPVDLPPNG